MPPVGFKEYTKPKTYTARKATNKVLNFIWWVIGMIIFITIAYYVFPYVNTWRGQVSNAIEHPVEPSATPIHR